MLYYYLNLTNGMCKQIPQEKIEKIDSKFFDDYFEGVFSSKNMRVFKINTIDELPERIITIITNEIENYLDKLPKKNKVAFVGEEYCQDIKLPSNQKLKTQIAIYNMDCSDNYITTILKSLYYNTQLETSEIKEILNKIFAKYNLQLSTNINLSYAPLNWVNEELFFKYYLPSGVEYYDTINAEYLQDVRTGDILDVPIVIKSEYFKKYNKDEWLVAIKDYIHRTKVEFEEAEKEFDKAKALYNNLSDGEKLYIELKNKE